MILHFLGGADEVGASCTLVEISGHKILIDCGIRMKKRGDSNLPEMKKIDEIGIDCIILTHAHIDHSGALPVIYQKYNVPLYLTPPTLSIIGIMLLDAIKIMEMDQEQEIPLYSLQEVERVMNAARPVRYNDSIELFGGDVRCTFYPAGHILGAASIMIEGKGDGRLMAFGDISITPQVTIEGLSLPSGLKNDFAIIESTYGGRQHSNRIEQEQNIVKQTDEVLKRGGTILFPAFAVGRAQEILLILSRAMRRKQLPVVPIIVDGLVKNICKVYSTFPEDVTSWLKNWINKSGNPFFYDKSPITPAWTMQDREKYAQMSPSVIVASSGMLMGGPSQFYAQKIADNPKNFIAITGYQDEESPGRHIQNLAAQGGGTLHLPSGSVELKCGIGTYSLSAHADTDQIVESLVKAGTKRVALVHGEGGAREALAEATKAAGIRDISMPALGETITTEKKRIRRKKLVQENAECKIEFEHLKELCQQLIRRDGIHRPYTVQELMIAFGYSPQNIDTEEIARVEDLLSSKMSPFKRDPKKNFLFRVRVDSKGNITFGKAYSQFMKDKRLNQGDSVTKIDEIFPEESGLYKRSFWPNSNVAVFHFYFPKVAVPKYQEYIDRVTKETGWEVRTSSKVHQGKLMEKALEAMPEAWGTRKNPSIRIEDEKVTIYPNVLEQPLTKEIQKKFDEFTETTGFTIDINFPKDIVALQQSQGSQQSQTQPVPASSEGIEINSAYTLIKKKFADIPHELFKTSRKTRGSEAYIELAFITPEVGKLYIKLIEELQQETKWPIEIKSNPDDFKVKELAKNLVSEYFHIVKNPSLYREDHLVIVQVEGKIHEKLEKTIQEKFFEQTRFSIELVNP